MTVICLFDINETVLDLSALDGLFTEAFADPQARTLWFNQGLQNAMSAELAGQHRPFEEHGQAALKMLGERLGRPVDEVLQQRVATALTRLPAHADVQPALLFARERGIRCIAFSNNARAAIVAQLQAAGIADGFEHILSAADVGTLKPAGAAYRHVAATLGEPVEALWLIAVHAWDVAGAQAAGLRGALVQRQAAQVANPLAPPRVQGRDLSEVLQRVLADEGSH